MAHFAVRGLMHEAALKADEDPDRLWFPHAIRIVRRKLTAYGAIPPSGRKAWHNSVLEEILQERVVTSRNRRNPRGVKRKMSSYPLRPRNVKPLPPIAIREAIRIVK